MIILPPSPLQPSHRLGIPLEGEDLVFRPQAVLAGRGKRPTPGSGINRDLYLCLRDAILRYFPGLYLD